MTLTKKIKGREVAITETDGKFFVLVDGRPLNTQSISFSTGKAGGISIKQRPFPDFDAAVAAATRAISKFYI
jgi:hypothetical protein